MSDQILSQLQKIPALKSVPESQLEWLVQQGENPEFKQGELLFRKGSPIDRMLIILKGRFVLRIEQNNQYRVVAYMEPNDITGLLPYSRAREAIGQAEAMEDSSLLTLDKSKFDELIKGNHELTTALVHVMSSRIRDYTKKQQQDDKMMSLGKLSAGLAHELNNPSAAVVRSAQELKKHLGFLPEGFKQVIQIKTSPEEVDQINDLLFSKVEEKKDDQRSMLEKSGLEDEILDWLEENEMEDADEIAEVLADFDIQIEDLDMVKELLRPQDLLPVVNWFSQVLTTERLVNEIEDASQRIGKLVGSVKSYTHMDQAPEKIASDIHVGLRNTMTMLGHKFRKGQIEIIENFSADLPQPKVFVSELNQVWTNLIDNAIDAMENSQQKTLEIETLRDGDFVNVNIKDSGSGIPEAVVDKIFDPFFTTKPVGKGTGLGLDVVQQIITQHNGAITVKSEPGKTVFNVCLPLN